MRTTTLLTTVCLVGLLSTACRPADPGGVTVYNSAPAASITAPVNESSAFEGAAVTFEGVVSDDGGMDNLLVSWSSDIDGPLSENEIPGITGHVEFTTASLTPGNHVISLFAIDDQAEKGEDFIAISVADVPDAPTIYVVHPVGGEFGEEGEDFEFVAKVSDSQDPPEAIEVTIESNLDGWICTVVADAVGIAECEADLDPGDHTLTFTATDLDGFVSAVDQYFGVVSLEDIDNDGDGFTEALGDCDDDDDEIYPGNTEIPNFKDDDCNGIVDDGTEFFDDDGDGMTELGGDCDDSDPAIWNNAPEIIDGKDNDCDGVIDDGTDGYDDDGDGWTENQGDCDDGDDDVYPGANEVMNGEDDDCNGAIDDNTVGYDDDGDGFTELQGDCNDADATISPGATEVGDFKDNDCNGLIDDGTGIADDDGDGFSEDQGDCDDGDATVYPESSPGAGDAAPELQDGKDNDCDGRIDDGTSTFDDDGDGWTEIQGDCDDGEPRAFPGAPEIEDGIDNDCDGTVDEGGQSFDDDGDGHSEDDGDCNDFDASVYPGAAEVCDDGKDSDCDGNANEENSLNCQTFYQDADDDGAGAPGTGKCLCITGANGEWDAFNDNDCYDANGNAKPGSTGYYTTHRGDGSYDYDCDGSESRRWTTGASCGWEFGNCVAAPPGWKGGTPACGSTGTWTNDCSACWSACCEDSSSSKNQECR